MLVHQAPLHERLEGRAALRATAWSLASWGAYGGQLTVLVAAVGADGFSMFLLCTGAMALAVPVGVLFLPVPAGAGVREVVLALVLTTALPSGRALAVVVASRVILVACDVALAGAGIALSRFRPEQP